MSDFIFDLSQIQHVALAFWKIHQNKKIFAFYAPMGSGKTTFIHTLCKDVLKIAATVASPTFSIINEYDSIEEGTVFHMDWYRLKDEEDAINAGVEDTLLSGNLCFIEWPEKAENLLPDGTVHVHIEVLDAHTRRIFASEQ